MFSHLSVHERVTCATNTALELRILNFENMTGRKGSFCPSLFHFFCTDLNVLFYLVNPTSLFYILRSHAVSSTVFFVIFLLNFMIIGGKEVYSGSRSRHHRRQRSSGNFFYFYFFLHDMKTILVTSQVFGISLLINNDSKTVKNWSNFYSPLKTSGRMCLFSLILFSFLSVI